MRHAPIRPIAWAALASTLTATAVAAPPGVKGTTPFGVTRGSATELTVQGSNLDGNPRLIAPFAFTLGDAPAGSDASNFKLRIKADPSTAVGVYPVRVQTDDGLSDPILLAVGQLPVAAEKEDNNTFETAQKFDAPAVVEGQSAGNDVDFFRFSGKKGQRIVVDAQCARIGSGVDPSIRLTTADRTFVASADDTPGLLTDARLVTVLPEDTDYVVEISDSRYQGGGRPIYRLLVGEVPLAEEVYPLGGRRGETVGFELRGGTLDGVSAVAMTLVGSGEATQSRLKAAGGSALDVESIGPVALGDTPEVREPADPKAEPVRAATPVVLNGRIDPEGDEDRFTLAVVAGQKYRVEVEAAESGSALDGVLNVLNPKGESVANADDTNIPAKAGTKQPAMVSPDPSLEYAVPAGQTEITLALKDLQGRGGVGFPYRIKVTRVVPGFEVSLNDPQISIPKGGTAGVGVGITRKGFNGPITLKVGNPPPGVSVRPGLAADGQAVGAFTVSAAGDLAPGPYTLDVIGEGAGPDGPIVERASATVVFAQQSNMPTESASFVGLPAAPALETPITLEVPEAPVELVHGYGGPVVVKANRKEGSTGVLAFGTLPLPPGLAVPEVKTDDKATEATVNVNTTTDHPVGKVSIVLTAKGKIAGADRTFAAPALTLDVVRPAALEVAGESVEVKAGESVEVKGKVVRKGPFKEPVTVKVDGLPAGVKAEPVTVAPDASEFTLTLKAEEKAAAASAGAKVALAFQVNKKDYPAITTPLAVKVNAAK